MHEADPEELHVAKSHLRFPVVGIGASAGGISALQRLLAKMPADAGMAFVVVMHLSPDHESALGSILQKAGKLPVVTVVAATPIEANHIYVISPAMKLVMSDGHLHVSKLATWEGRRQSVDLFFRSLAQAHEERAVCVVLSGTGSDGAQGLKRIKELGGVALAQSPEDAEFDGMPRAAVQTGLVDFVLPADEIAAKLALLWDNAKRIELPAPPAGLEAVHAQGEAEVLAEEALLSIKALLRERTGHDFSHYKRGTVLRRLERRLQVNAIPDLPSYRRMLDSQPGETSALLQDMLISVTNFYRDPLTFTALQEGIKKYIEDRASGEPFRVWVAGCATGEEAYSIAILLRELLNGTSIPLQIFASDIDQRAIASARTGLFPASIANDVAPERLRDFFVPEASGLRIAKNVRESVVFSVHNVLSDPPFTRIDLISCRNLLIYLDRFAQAQVLKSFHFALKPKGLLLLGSSETADATDGLFEGIDKTHRVYRASITSSRARILPPLPGRMPVLPPPVPPSGVAEPAKPPLEVLHERVLRNYAPPSVLVDADDTVLHVSQRASHLLRMPAGAPTNKLLALTRPELRAELRAALGRAAETGRTVEAPRVRLTVNGEVHTVIMTVRPAKEELPKGLMLVVFDEAEESLVSAAEGSTTRDPLVDSLEAELFRTQERLRSTVGESSASTEELRASNEELQTINEELRSTTEELETSREELQAVNEELTTVNVELTLRVEETGKLNDDLQNLMTSAEIGTVFVDREMRLNRFTPQAATLFNLLPPDVGRPLLDITHRLDYPQLSSDVAEVLRDLKRIEREVHSQDDRWFLARIVPYRTSEDRIDGAVLAFFDITTRRQTERQLQVSEQRMRLVADSMRDYAILTTDEQGLITTWSPGAERIFGYDAKAAVGQHFELIFTPEDRLAGVPRHELTQAREQGRAVDERWHLHKDGQRIYCSGITTTLVDGRIVGFAKVARDLTTEELQTQRREALLMAEQATSSRLQEAGTMKDEFLAVVSHELKNPLSIIQMNAMLLARMPHLSADPRAIRSTQAIQKAVTSQSKIITDLLELSRTNMGKVVLHPAVLDFGELVRSVVDAIGPDVEAKGQTLAVDLAQASVYADLVRTEQIVWNLLTNAVKFTPRGGHIGVAISVNGAMAKLTVTDSGIGIDPRNLLAIFEMFRQVETGPGRRTTGLGIGLALAKQLAELNGGRIEAASEGLDKGASFSVWLPMAVADRSILLGTAPAGGLAGLKLLLVDDEVDLLQAFGMVLEGEGAQVTLADNATRALELATAAAFDVIVSDIAMPTHDGYWLATKLREDASTRDTALVAVSGMYREVDQAKALEVGFDAHVGKPLELHLLQAAVLKALGQKPGRNLKRP